MDIRRRTGALRHRLPAPVTVTLRGAVLAWGRLTADFRMTPSVLVVGAQRSGTTTLFRLLEAHPNLVRPTLVKGTGYFDDGYAHGARWYAAHFPLRLTARWLARGGPVSTFECSGYYLFHPLAAARIARDLPGVQVVVLVRDPVERACSAYRHEFARGFETVSFEEAVSLEPFRTAGEGERLAADPDYRSFEHRHHAYLQRSDYAPQIQRFVDALGVDRVHVVEADEFFADPVTQFLALQRSLGLPEWEPDEVGHWNARPGRSLPVARRAELLHHFERSDAWLAELLGHTPSWRTARVAS